MRHSITILVITGAIALTVFALSGANWLQDGRSCCGEMATQESSMAVMAEQHDDSQTATVTINGGYSPSTIQVSVGKPVELTFIGGENIGCGGTVVFESLNIRKTVAAGNSIVIKFTPKSKGEIPFTCGMGMYKGKVVVN